MGLAFREVVPRLGRIRVLRYLPTQVLATLASSCREVNATKGTRIFSPGTAAAVHLLLRGRVGMVAHSRPGTEVQLATIRPGELFGEISLFLGHQVDEARTLEAAGIVVLDADALWAALRECPRAVLDLAVLMAERRMAAETRLAEFALHSVSDRLLCLLRRMASECAVTDSRGHLLAETVTHEELARLVGADRVSVTKALAALRRGGHVVTVGHRIVLTNPVAGPEMSCEVRSPPSHAPGGGALRSA